MTPETSVSPLVARRAFAPEGYDTLADVGLDLPLVSPYQLACGNPSGPVLVTYNYLDAPTARAYRDELTVTGYLPDMLFNRVLDIALRQAGLARGDLYVTHAFHALPAARSAAVPQRLVEESFSRITRLEVAGRPVIALGHAAARACTRFAVRHTALPHPSARGLTRASKAASLANALAPFARSAA